MNYHSDYQNYLFKRSEVAALLESAGYPLSSLSHSTSEEAAQPPQWMRIYAAKSALRAYEAAWIIEGKEPPNTYPEGSVGKKAEWRALDAINDSVLAGDIVTRDTQFHIDDEPKTWLLDHQSIIEWCQRAGYEWPLSKFMQPMPKSNEKSTDPESPDQVASLQSQPELNQELSDLRQEVAELRAEVEELKRSVPLHPGGLMGKAIEVQHEYWQDPENSPPKSEGIIGKLREQDPELSEVKARAIEAVACPVKRGK